MSGVVFNVNRPRHLLISDSMGRNIKPPNCCEKIFPGHETWSIKDKLDKGEISLKEYTHVILQIGTVDCLNMFDQYRICEDDSNVYREHMVNKVKNRIDSVVQQLRVSGANEVILVSSVLPIPKFKELSKVFLSQLNSKLKSFPNRL